MYTVKYFAVTSMTIAFHHCDADYGSLHGSFKNLFYCEEAHDETHWLSTDKYCSPTPDFTVYTELHQNVPPLIVIATNTVDVNIQHII